MPASPQMEISLDEWIEYCENLSAIENFLLVGLISRSQFTSLPVLQSQTLETKENWQKAEKWVLEHLREGLKIYCNNYKKYQIEIGLEAGKNLSESAKEFIKSVAPTIAYATSGVKGLGIAFTVWLLKYTLDKWCLKYTDKKFNGKGNYFCPTPESSFEAFFEVTYTPPIIVYSEDEAAYPSSVFKKEVKVPAQTKGLIRVSNQKTVRDIYSYFNDKEKHSFNFSDSKTNIFIEGFVDAVAPAPDSGANVLRLIAEELKISNTLSQ